MSKLIQQPRLRNLSIQASLDSLGLIQYMQMRESRVTEALLNLKPPLNPLPYLQKPMKS